MAMPKRPQPRAGGRAPLSRARALDEAMSLADSGGLDQLTMRRLAEVLGVEAMSLYHHVANKDDILDGIVDRVFAEIEATSKTAPWKEAMRRRAHSARAALSRHPWALWLVESRTSPGPTTLAHHDAVLGCLRHAGFSIALTGHAYSVLDSYTYGFVHTEQNLPFQSAEETKAVATEMMKRFPIDQYPHLVEFATQRVLEPGYAYGNEFSVGLELILDGLERALRAEQSGRLPPGPKNSRPSKRRGRG